MSECRDTVERLPGYLDAVLPPEAHASVSRHLTVCGSCRRREFAPRGAAAVLKQRAAALRAEPVPPGLRSRCEAALAAGVPSERPTARRWIAVLVPTAIAAALIIVTGIALFKVATERSSTVLAA